MRYTNDQMEILKRSALIEGRPHAPGEIYGYITQWFSVAVDRDGTMISPGAFSDYLASDAEIACIINHDWSRGVLARRSEGLFLEQDGKGLYIEFPLPRSPIGQHVRAMADTMPSLGCSFNYVIQKQEYRDGIKYLTKLALKEVSILLNQEEGAIPGSRAWLAREFICSNRQYGPVRLNKSLGRESGVVYLKNKPRIGVVHL